MKTPKTEDTSDGFVARRSTHVTGEEVRPDGDEWQETLAVCELAGKLTIRSYYSNRRTKERHWDEPPSGASKVINATESMRRMANLQLQEMQIATGAVPDPTASKDLKERKKGGLGGLFRRSGSKVDDNNNSQKPPLPTDGDPNKPARNRIQYRSGSFLARAKKESRANNQFDENLDLSMQHALARSLNCSRHGQNTGSDDEMELAMALSVSESHSRGGRDATPQRSSHARSHSAHRGDRSSHQRSASREGSSHPRSRSSDKSPLPRSRDKDHSPQRSAMSDISSLTGPNSTTRSPMRSKSMDHSAADSYPQRSQSIDQSGSSSHSRQQIESSSHNRQLKVSSPRKYTSPMRSSSMDHTAVYSPKRSPSMDDTGGSHHHRHFEGSSHNRQLKVSSPGKSTSPMRSKSMDHNAVYSPRRSPTMNQSEDSSHTRQTKTSSPGKSISPVRVRSVDHTDGSHHQRHFGASSHSHQNTLSSNGKSTHSRTPLPILAGHHTDLKPDPPTDTCPLDGSIVHLEFHHDEEEAMAIALRLSMLDAEKMENEKKSPSVSAASMPQQPNLAEMSEEEQLAYVLALSEKMSPMPAADKKNLDTNTETPQAFRETEKISAEAIGYFPAENAPRVNGAQYMMALNDVDYDVVPSNRKGRDRTPRRVVSPRSRSADKSTGSPNSQSTDLCKGHKGNGSSQGTLGSSQGINSLSGDSLRHSSHGEMGLRTDQVENSGPRSGANSPISSSSSDSMRHTSHGERTSGKIAVRNRSASPGKARSQDQLRHSSHDGQSSERPKLDESLRLTTHGEKAQQKLEHSQHRKRLTEEELAAREEKMLQKAMKLSMRDVVAAKSPPAAVPALEKVVEKPSSQMDNHQRPRGSKQADPPAQRKFTEEEIAAKEERMLQKALRASLKEQETVVAKKPVASGSAVHRAHARKKQEEILRRKEEELIGRAMQESLACLGEDPSSLHDI